MKGNYISSLAKGLKDLVAIWGTLTLIVAGVITYFQEHSDIAAGDYIWLAVIVVMIVVGAIVWAGVEYKTSKTDKKVNSLEVRVDEGINGVQRSLLRMDVDRFYKDHINDDALSEDDMKYVYMLRDKLIHYNVNSFNQRKVEELLEKPMKPKKND